MLLRYTQVLIAQVGQTAMCNRYHSIDQQLSRRLLMGLVLTAIAVEMILAGLKQYFMAPQ